MPKFSASSTLHRWGPGTFRCFYLEPFCDLYFGPPNHPNYGQPSFKKTIGHIWALGREKNTRNLSSTSTTSTWRLASPRLRRSKRSKHPAPCRVHRTCDSDTSSTVRGCPTTCCPVLSVREGTGRWCEGVAILEVPGQGSKTNLSGTKTDRISLDFKWV